jgi:hypothetical protein
MPRSFLFFVSCFFYIFLHVPPFIGALPVTSCPPVPQCSSAGSC